jgi:fructose-1,6-bisphosphatase
MAIQPIDLQALFTQLDKVGKAQMVQREGQQIQESLQQAESSRKLEQNVQSVNQSQEMGKEAETIRDENRQKGNSRQGTGAKGKSEEEDDSVNEEGRALIRDPSLGRIVDISG